MLKRIRDLFRSAGASTKAAPVPPRSDRGAAFKAEGEAFLAAGKLPEAARCFRAAIEADPADTAAYVSLAYSLREQGQVEAAVAMLGTLLSRDPNAVEGRFLLALTQQSQGRLPEAIRSLEALLELHPEVVEARVRLCLLQVQSGNIEAAVAVVDNGIARNPEAADLQYLSGNLKLHRGQLEAAIAAYGRALASDPAHAEAHYNCGGALQIANRPTEALAHFEMALRTRPEYPVALVHRGGVLLQLGRTLEALASFDDALKFDPGMPEALNDRGAALAKLGRPGEALVSYDRALQTHPDLTAAWINKGKVLRELKRPQEALVSFERALQVAPDDADLLNNFGLLLRDLKRSTEALDAIDKAVRNKPDFAEAINNRGLVLQELYRPEEALVEYDRSLALKADLADTHANRGNVLQELERHEEALAAYQRALEIRPRYEAIYFNESLSRLVLGDLLGGWPKYEWRWQASSAIPPARKLTEPMWQGEEPLAGKTLLLYAEQGLGDTIQFVRYAKTLSDRGAKVLLRVQAPLVPLLKCLTGVERLLAADEPPPRFDYHCPLLSLPLALRTTLETIPAADAYIRPAGPRFAEQLEAWQARLGAKDKPRIGLVWSGNAHHKNDRNRSIPLRDFARMVSAKARFVSLQNEIREADAAVLAQRGDIAWFGAALVDFAETAALVARLDLVISVDTSVAHLAAAMGKPVWLLLPVNPDWRWLLEREDSPWYPTMRLFRQSRRGDWSDVMVRVEQEIARLG